MTDVVPIPEGILSTEFPTNADRTAGTFNPKVVAWGFSARDMSERDREIAVAGRTNALAAKAAAAAAVPAAAQSVAARNEAVPAAAQAVAARDQAVPAAAQALDAAQRAEDAAASIEDGPVTSVNGKTGVVNLSIEDVVAPGDIIAYGSTKEEARDKIGATNGVIRRTERAASQQLTAQDLAHLIDITSGTFTQTFAAPATLGSGWWCYMQNSGDGDITLQAPAGSSIDGLASYVMYPSECRLLQCDGSVLRSIVITPMRLIKRTSFDFIKPPGYREWVIDMRGATGGGGGGGSGNLTVGTKYAGGGGGGGSGSPGGRWHASFLDALVPSSVSFVIGAAGVAGPGAQTPVTGFEEQGRYGTAGGVGGVSSVVIDGVTFSALGGLGGNPGRGGTSTTPGTGGSAAATGPEPTVSGVTAAVAAARYSRLAHQLNAGALGTAGSASLAGSAAQAPGGVGAPAVSSSLGAGESGAGGAGGPGLKSAAAPSVAQDGVDGEPGMVMISGVM